MNPKPGSILIVDDNEELLIALRMLLSDVFGHIDTLRHPRKLLRQLDTREYDLVLLDMNFGTETPTGNEGLYWMGRILERKPAPSVVLITAYSDVEPAVRGIKNGAVDFILKSWDNEKILSAIQSAYRLHCSRRKIDTLQQKQEHLADDIDRQHAFYRGVSPVMAEVYRMIEKVAPTGANVLLLGENGTGKEVLAREIHRLSARRTDIFVSIDMGSIAESLFESELFGYRKGAFTDAKTNKAGRFELASGGTLFLDEIGNLSPAMQQKLLAVLQNRQVIPVGALHPVNVDVRLVCATNADIHRLVDEGLFRKDLFYRLNTIVIEIPPLRSRREDIPGLANFFVDRYHLKYAKSIRLSDAAIASLTRGNWPGNIRELKHAIEKAVILADSDTIDDITPGDRKAAPASVPESFNLEENERRIIQAALRYSAGNVSDAARKLGINRSTLYEKMKKYGI
ncbi:MAG: sigma-54 dependent transcriptional regulator [Bacteroidales bacterium]|nr:sigma-54 dependent transcriptional regulator [Bacteroidales bacterium]